jgi:hypothetical protein
MVTDCAELYVPPATENAGVAAVVDIVYETDATALLVKLAATAIASIVSLLLTVIGPAYLVEPVVGAAPFVV